MRLRVPSESDHQVRLFFLMQLQHLFTGVRLLNLQALARDRSEAECEPESPEVVLGQACETLRRRQACYASRALRGFWQRFWSWVRRRLGI